MVDIVKILENKRVRPTAMRLLVYKLLANRENAISLGELEKDFKTSERSTLYRTIKTFEERGLVHAIEDGTGIIKYAICENQFTTKGNNDLHLHFRCNTCQETVCLTDYKIPQINLPKGYEAENMNLIIRGICEKCNVD
ncbi:Fur family transcriptional regulator [Flavobacterium litorale]|uniref:Transcriptional repressor n=1 Tax=Flavobacterium litorale TaxID=2856519 RepID=A0ABX8V915_9FLAO|nr:transcriptional repressor [Flavobacterium litorale]QYJ69345.1 transcriptional repressor [Flavobacterium litorale]